MERATNAILEDERLRGALTDDEYAPIQAATLKWLEGQLTSGAQIDAAVAEAKDRIRRAVARRQR